MSFAIKRHLPPVPLFYFILDSATTTPAAGWHCPKSSNNCGGSLFCLLSIVNGGPTLFVREEDEVRTRRRDHKL